MTSYTQIIDTLITEWGAEESDAYNVVDAEITAHPNTEIALKIISEWLLNPPVRQFNLQEIPHLIATYRPCALYISCLISWKLFDNVNPYKEKKPKK